MRVRISPSAPKMGIRRLKADSRQPRAPRLCGSPPQRPTSFPPPRPRQPQAHGVWPRAPVVQPRRPHCRYVQARIVLRPARLHIFGQVGWRCGHMHDMGLQAGLSAWCRMAAGVKRCLAQTTRIGERGTAAAAPYRFSACSKQRRTPTHHPQTPTMYHQQRQDRSHDFVSQPITTPAPE